MKDQRPGEELWEFWDGEGYDPKIDFSTIYYTIDHVDFENDLVRRALASALQRDGVAISLSEGFNLIDKSIPYTGWLGYVDESLYTCDDSGETEYGDLVEKVFPATWIEV
jgi:hypothetical protein